SLMTTFSTCAARAAGGAATSTKSSAASISTLCAGLRSLRLACMNRFPPVGLHDKVQDLAMLTSLLLSSEDRSLLCGTVSTDFDGPPPVSSQCQVGKIPVWSF